MYRLKSFGVNIKSQKGMLPIEFVGSTLLKPIKYVENKGSAQIKTCIILSAINTHGVTKVKAIKSRDHTELMLKSLNYQLELNEQINLI